MKTHRIADLPPLAEERAAVRRGIDPMAVRWSQARREGTIAGAKLPAKNDCSKL